MSLNVKEFNNLVTEVQDTIKDLLYRAYKDGTDLNLLDISIRSCTNIDPDDDEKGIRFTTYVTELIKMCEGKWLWNEIIRRERVELTVLERNPNGLTSQIFNAVEE